MEVAPAVIEAILAEAGRTAPEECCGLLFGHDGMIEQARPAANVADRRRDRFEIDPQALVDAHRAARGGGPKVAGYFHSHPGGAPVPSPVDCREAPGDGMVWAIAGAGAEIRFWRDQGGTFAPLPYTVISD